MSGLCNEGGSHARPHDGWSPVSNQRPVSRSCDHSRPIRASVSSSGQSAHSVTCNRLQMINTHSSKMYINKDSGPQIIYSEFCNLINNKWPSNELQSMIKYIYFNSLNIFMKLTTVSLLLALVTWWLSLMCSLITRALSLLHTKLSSHISHWRSLLLSSLWLYWR